MSTTERSTIAPGLPGLPGFPSSPPARQPTHLPLSIYLGWLLGLPCAAPSFSILRSSANTHPTVFETPLVTTQHPRNSSKLYHHFYPAGGPVPTRLFLYRITPGKVDATASFSSPAPRLRFLYAAAAASFLIDKSSSPPNPSLLQPLDLDPLSRPRPRPQPRPRPRSRISGLRAAVKMPPRSSLTSSFSITDANNEVVCPLRNQDGSSCRKRCVGVRLFPSSLLFPLLFLYPPISSSPRPIGLKGFGTRSPPAAGVNENKNCCRRSHGTSQY